MSSKAKGRNRKEAKQKRRGDSKTVPHLFKVGQLVWEKEYWLEKDGVRTRIPRKILYYEENGRVCAEFAGDSEYKSRLYAPETCFQTFNEIEYFNPKRNRWQKTPS